MEYFFLMVVILHKYIFQQAYVHKVVMDELERIIEDSEVCHSFKF